MNHTLLLMLGGLLITGCQRRKTDPWIDGSPLHIDLNIVTITWVWGGSDPTVWTIETAATREGSWGTLTLIAGSLRTFHIPDSDQYYRVRGQRGEVEILSNVVP